MVQCCVHSAGAKHSPRVPGQPCLQHQAACEARQDGTRAHGRGDSESEAAEWASGQRGGKDKE